LVFLTSEMRFHSDRLARYLDEASELESLQADIVRFERAHNLEGLTGSGEYSSGTDENQLRQRASDLGRNPTPSGIHFVEATRRNLETYFAARRAADASTAPFEEVIRRTNPSFQMALAAID